VIPYFVENDFTFRAGSRPEGDLFNSVAY